MSMMEGRRSEGEGMSWRRREGEQVERRRSRGRIYIGWSKQAVFLPCNDAGSHLCFSVLRPTPVSHCKQHSSESVIFNQPLTPHSAHMIVDGGGGGSNSVCLTNTASYGAQQKNALSTSATSCTCMSCQFRYMCM